MKANSVFLTFASLFFFVMSSFSLKAESNSVIYHNVEKQGSTISTTYLKGSSDNTNLSPFKKKVDTVNEQGQCISKITYQWDSSRKDWIPASKMDYTYNGDVVTSVSYSLWNKRTKQWDTPQVTDYSEVSQI